MYMYIHIHTYTHFLCIYIHTYTHFYTYMHTHVCVYIYIYIHMCDVRLHTMTCDLRLSTRQATYTTLTQVWVHSARTRHRSAACVFSSSYIQSLNTQPAPRTHRYESAARELEKNMPLSGVHRLSFWDITENPRFFVVWFRRYIAARAT